MNRKAKRLHKSRDKFILKDFDSVKRRIDR